MDPINADTKLIVSWSVGDRTAECARAFMDDVSGRLASRVQLTSDGHKVYLDAVLGVLDQVDFDQLVKLYGAEGGKGEERKYSPAEFTGGIKKPVAGNPGPEAHFNELRRAPEPQHADGHAAVHRAHERFLEED